MRADKRPTRKSATARLRKAPGNCTCNLVSNSVEIIPPQRNEHGHFLPGVSGNPNGRISEQKREVQELARLHSVEAIETAVMIMRTSKSETNRLVAANMLLDRGWGRPRQSVEVEEHGRSLEQILQGIAAAREAEQEAAKKPERP